jgi:catechol 2,3-dioxygenase-like lactoylglutathione lyase family enzyme
VITGFNHTSFTVADIERAVGFWRDVLGFKAAPVAERTGSWVAEVTGVAEARIKVAHLYGYGHHMEFIEYAGVRPGPSTLAPDRPGVGHVCLEVQDIHGTYRKLLQAGALPQGEMVDIRDPGLRPCRAGYLRDPNGIIIELLELTPDQTDEQRQGERP